MTALQRGRNQRLVGWSPYGPKRNHQQVTGVTKDPFSEVALEDYRQQLHRTIKGMSQVSAILQMLPRGLWNAASDFKNIREKPGAIGRTQGSVLRGLLCCGIIYALLSESGLPHSSSLNILWGEEVKAIRQFRHTNKAGCANLILRLNIAKTNSSCGKSWLATTQVKSIATRIQLLMWTGSKRQIKLRIWKRGYLYLVIIRKRKHEFKLRSECSEYHGTQNKCYTDNFRRIDSNPLHK